MITSNTIVRCRSCRTYINPFVTFLDQRRWKCNLCYRVNDGTIRSRAFLTAIGVSMSSSSSSSVSCAVLKYSVPSCLQSYISVKLENCFVFYFKFADVSLTSVLSPSVPDEFMYNPVTRSYGEPHKRPEVQNATVEFIASSDYMVTFLPCP